MLFTETCEISLTLNNTCRKRFSFISELNCKEVKVAVTKQIDKYVVSLKFLSEIKCIFLSVKIDL